MWRLFSSWIEWIPARWRGARGILAIMLSWPKVGIFAQRGKNRPNQIGVTICKIVSVEGLSVHVEGLDAIDGTPVLDLKPWVAEFGPRGPVAAAVDIA